MRIFKKQTWFAIARNLIFWAVSFFVLLRLFNRTEYINPIDVIYTFLFHIPLWIGVGLHAYALRNSFDKGKYGVYAFQFLLLTLTVIPQGYFFSFDVLADWIFPDFYFVAVYSWPEIIGIGAIYVIITLLLHVAISWSKQQEELKKVSELREQKRTAELQALRAQINPHFLFNALNTVASLIVLERAPDARHAVLPARVRPAGQRQEHVLPRPAAVLRAVRTAVRSGEPRPGQRGRAL